MSRIGKIPVTIPGKVKAKVEGSVVSIEGPRGRLSHTFPADVSVVCEDALIRVSPANETRFARAMYGTARALIANMVKGVVDGYSKELEIQGVGFRANLKGSTLDLALGYSHPIRFPVPEGIKVTAAVDDTTKHTRVKIEGCDKQLVGKVAAEIRSYYPPEPYKGKGVRIVGERVRRKEGKTVG